MNKFFAAVLEDERYQVLAIREVFKTKLPEWDYFISTDGKQFLRDLASHPTPGIIILDNNTPKLSGMGVLEIIHKREDLKNLPIVMYSTEDSIATRSKASLFGAWGFVKKTNLKNMGDELYSICNSEKYKATGVLPDTIFPPLLIETMPPGDASENKSIDDLLGEI